VAKSTDTKTKVTSAAPDERKLTARQGMRLSKLSGVDVEHLQGRSVAELATDLRWRIDPAILLFRRICGQVVKTDPVTGVDLPVPFATVNVYDTDCDFLGYFPVASPWAWFYPIFCWRELMASTVADACGNFCVWIPWFDIDWIVRWRLEWECDPVFWTKPSIADLIRRLRLVETEANPVIPHGPGPVSAAALVKDGGRALQKVTELLGPERGTQVQLAVRNAATSGKGRAARVILDQPAFAKPVPPPMSPKLADLHSRYTKEGSRFLSAHLGKTREGGHQFDLSRYVGPFLSWDCHLELEEEIIPIFEVPDISFEVTQDVDGDGDQEVIYSDGYFDVGWSSGTINDITLHTSQIAVATLNCGPMNPLDCAEDGSGLGIVSASLMPLSGPLVGTPYFDSTTGYGERPNPPHSDGALRASVAGDRPATAPFARTLLLRGCNNVPPNGAFYRVLYKYNGGPEAKFLSLSWPTFRPLGNTPVWVSPDVDGWYPVLPDPANWLVPYLLLAWPTYNFQNGDYQVRLEIGDIGKAHVAYSSDVKFKVDNSSPGASFLSLAWRVAQNNTLPCSDPSWTPLPLTCPVVRRNVGDNIEFCVSWQASATHLRDAALYPYGCGAVSAVLQQMTSPDSVGHWHTAPADNNVTRSAIFRLNYAADNQGAYGFNINAYSRAFDPGDTTGYVADWLYDIAWVGGTLASVSIAVVNH
jgi:hypothetical protein